MLVKFTSYRARQKLFVKRSKLKGAKGVNANVYINEDLCKARADLAYKARTARKQRLIADTWIFDGKVFVKDSAGNVRTVFDDSFLKGASGSNPSTDSDDHQKD